MSDLMTLLQSFQLPETACFAEVKQAYRRLSKTTHPDSGGDLEAFKQLSGHFQLLKTAAERGLLPMEKGETSRSVITIEGRSLSEFGQGLGPTTNGRTCTQCQGNGYLRYKTLTHHMAWQACPGCAGSGKWRDNVCNNCCGNGKLLLPTYTDVYSSCFACKGIGEIEIFNPVLVKGRLSKPTRV